MEEVNAFPAHAIQPNDRSCSGKYNLGVFRLVWSMNQPRSKRNGPDSKQSCNVFLEGKIKLHQEETIIFTKAKFLICFSIPKNKKNLKS